VVAHFVNFDWQLEKTIIGLRLIDVSHYVGNIATHLLTVLEEYALTDKVFAVTLDNASANSNAVERPRPRLSTYVGKLFLHQRCACHIINLIVKSGFNLEAFGTTISFLNSSNRHIAAYKSYCVATDKRPRKFGLDMEVRWNSTYLMLKHFIPYKDTFSVFVQTHYPRGHCDPMLLIEARWYFGEKILEYLKLFMIQLLHSLVFTILHVH
jgi:hypothetical protein